MSLRRAALVSVLAAAAACGSQSSEPAPAERKPGPTPPPAWASATGDMLGPLPAASKTTSTRFTGAEDCGFCHSSEAGSKTLKDAAGRDVSPYNSWKATMMGLSTRDPYYLAVFRHELDKKPAAAAKLEATCTRCHAPMGSVERLAQGSSVHYDDLVGGKGRDQVLAREGVSCTLCHQIRPDNLGTPASYTGGYVIGEDRRIFGPHADPFVVPMQNHVDYTPEYAAHTEKSDMCGTCHTVITRALDDAGNAVGPEFPEQTPYLEWLASKFSDAGPEGKTCQTCHMPAVDDDGQPIQSPLSIRPPSGLKSRTLKGRHVFRGGNALMLRLLSENVEWTGAKVTAEELLAQSQRDEAMLGLAGTVAVVGARREGDELVVELEVTNDAGHKFPTGYPSRRVVLHVTATNAAGAVLFESGKIDEFGRVVRRDGKQLDGAAAVLPHRDVITSDEEVQVYEAVMADASGKPVKALIDATRYVKDNRLLPRGFRADHPAAAMIKPVGVEGDPGFGNSDRVTVRMKKIPAGATITAELVYQTLRPSELEALSEAPSPAALRLFDMLRRSEKRATVSARATATAP